MIKTGELEDATVFIDGDEMEMKTPFASDPITRGPHKIKVVKDGYEVYSDIVTVEGREMKTVNVKLTKIKPVNPYRNKGFVFIPEMNVSIADNTYRSAYMLMPTLNIEYMTSARFGLGIGTGLFYTGTGITSIPLLGQFSYYFNNRKASPFINFKAGYLISISKYTDQYNYHCSYEYNSFLLSLSAGVNFNHSRIGFSLAAARVQKSSNYGSSINYSYSLDFFFGITYSYMIPFGKKEKNK